MKEEAAGMVQEKEVGTRVGIVEEEDDMGVVTVAAGDMMTTREVLCPMEVMRARRSIRNLRVHLDRRAPTTDVRRPKRLCL